MPDFFSETVVCNTGPLLAFCRISRMRLISELFPQVVVPLEVAEELLVTPHADLPEIRESLSLFSIAPTPINPDPLLLMQLDRGEAAVIATAIRLGGLPIIMDERKGRRVASVGYGLRVKGSGGLLVAAKQRGLVSSIKPLLLEMRRNGYFLSDSLVAECLRIAGE